MQHILMGSSGGDVGMCNRQVPGSQSLLACCHKQSEQPVLRPAMHAGSTVDASKEPLFAGLLRQCPVPLYGGLPAPTWDLRWARGVDVHILGAYAALELGPGALNLAGGAPVGLGCTEASQAGGCCLISPPCIGWGALSVVMTHGDYRAVHMVTTVPCTW